MVRTEEEEEELVVLTSSHALSQHNVSDSGIDEYDNTGIVEESNNSLVARRGSSSDETDGTQSKSIRAPKKRKKRFLFAGSVPRWRIVALYLFLSTTALVLTVLSKRTKLWTLRTINKDDYDGSTRIRGTIIYSELYKLLSVYILLLLSFWAVQGSDPGYISHDHMAVICREDGLSLMGLDEEEEAGISKTGDLEYCSANPDSPNEIPGSSISGRDHPSEIEITRRNNVNPSASTPTSKLMMQDDEGGNDLSSSSQLNNLTSIATPLETKQSPLQSSDSVTNNHNKPFCTNQRRNPCLYCRFAPPLRSHHCKICNKCVASFDHHCTFIGTCIGERNHCRFWCFLTLQVVGFTLCSNVVGSSTLSFFQFLLHGDDSSMNSNPSLNNGVTSQFVLDREDVMPLDLLVVMTAKLYLYTLSFFAFFMWGLHTFLAISNLTTFELAKGPKHIEYLKDTETCDFPFSLGILGNIRLFCCQKDDSWRYVKRRLSLQQQQQQLEWIPILWKLPGKIVRDSEDWWAHPWQNKYWSCC